MERRVRGTGYAVPLVKAAVALRELKVGSVRAPLSDPTEEHLCELADLPKTGLDLAARITR